jgi:hypothetical protein
VPDARTDSPRERTLSLRRVRPAIAPERERRSTAAIGPGAYFVALRNQDTEPVDLVGCAL